MSASLFFTFVFYAAFVVYLFFGIFLIQVNAKSPLNRLFLAVSLSLCIWSLGFALTNSAETIELALKWRRLSVVGWASIHSLLLHFFLLLTSGEEGFNRGRQHALLHLPSLVLILTFSVSPRLALQNHNLVWTNYGWANLAVNNFWDYLFYIYYLSYTFVSMFLLWRWKKTTTDASQRKQASVFLRSLLVVLVVGTLVDVVWGVFFSKPLPQMTPIFILLPIARIYYAMKHYSLMPEEKSNLTEQILDKRAKNTLYQFLSLAFLAGGLLGFAAYFIQPWILDTAFFQAIIWTSFLSLLFGFLIFAFKWVKNETIKDRLILLVILSSIPVIKINFFPFASSTIWAFPIILLVVALVFNTRTQLYLIALISILSELLFWIHTPKSLLPFEGFNYLFRIGLFMIAFALGLVVNNIYIHRLKVNVQQTKFQRLISAISYDFMHVNSENIDGKIHDLLRRVGELYQIDRAYIISAKVKGERLIYTHEWCATGIKPVLSENQEIPWNSYPWLIRKLAGGQLVYYNDVNMLPNEANHEKKRLLKRKIKSIMVLPIEEQGQFFGFMGFHSQQAKEWSEEQMDLLRILANIVADGFSKIRSEKEIEFLAYYDELTGLPNRTLFNDRLAQTLANLEHEEQSVAVLLMDLDSFKTVNDMLGHMGGDQILKKVATSLVETLGSDTSLARFGGDEFMIQLNNLTGTKELITITQKIMEIFATPFIVAEQEFTITGSAGIAVYPKDGEDAATLLHNAEIAMYKAKANGKNQFALCTPYMKKEVENNLQMVNYLAKALAENQLLIYYQPQIDLRTEQIVGLEALMRWNHPELGMIPPNVFIPLAEKNGLIGAIGEWALATATAQNKAWQEQGFPPLRMAINLSVIQFNDPRIVGKIQDALAKTGLDPSYLELEITENVAIHDPRYTISRMTELKELGLSISIDDFGIEYSSLSRLKNLPVDRLKIDMHFIQGLEKNKKDKAITEVVINLAKSLDLEVIAEGVETNGQLEFLKAKECDEVQGYYYYKPMLAQEIEMILGKMGEIAQTTEEFTNSADIDKEGL